MVVYFDFVWRNICIISDRLRMTIELQLYDVFHGELILI
jgi:hypothetical protein